MVVVTSLKNSDLVKCSCCKKLTPCLVKGHKEASPVEEDKAAIIEKFEKTSKFEKSEKPEKREKKCCLRNELTTKIVTLAKSKLSTSSPTPPKDMETGNYDNKNFDDCLDIKKAAA